MPDVNSDVNLNVNLDVNFAANLSIKSEITIKIWLILVNLRQKGRKFVGSK